MLMWKTAWIVLLMLIVVCVRADVQSGERYWWVNEGTFTHTGYAGDPNTQRLRPQAAEALLRERFPFQRGFIRYVKDPASNREARWSEKVHVERFSKSTVIFKVVKWRQRTKVYGNIIETLERYATKRSPRLDDLLSLKVLEEKYCFEYKGVGQGATTAACRKALGKPDFIQTYQLMLLESWYYEKAGVSIFFKGGVAEEVRKVDDAFIAMIKESYPTHVPED